jgi:cytochrome c biogenesis protein CcdA
LRSAGAAVLGALGLVLLTPWLQQRLAGATAGLGNAGNDLLGRLRLDGLAGQFVIGLVLGIVWSPCVGPTLGAAIVLASQGRHLAQAAAVMALFGLGAALPILALAYAARSALVRERDLWLRVGKAGKVLMGAILVGIAALVISGADRKLETWIVGHAPDWITQLTTRY